MPGQSYLEPHAHHLLQETLINVLKRGHARRVDVSVRRDDMRLAVEVRDDGRGFDLATANHRQSGAGLASLRGHAARLGTELSLDTAPGRGLSLQLDILL